MSDDTTRPIDRTPRQVAGPGAEDDREADEDTMTDTAPRDPHPVVADPDDLERLRAEDVDDVDDVRDPIGAPVAGDPPPAHLAGGDPVPDEGPEPQPALVGEPVATDHDIAGDDAVDDRPGEPDDLEPGPDAEPAATDPVVEPDAVASEEPGPELDPDPVAVPAGFMADTSALRERWETVQVGFVDDPRRAVEEAHEMVAAAVAELQAQIDRQRDELGRSWRSDERSSTDALLTAFQGYRDLFDRVLAV